MSTPKLRLLACQIEVPEMSAVAQRDDYLERSVREVRRQLEQQPMDLVVLPELSSVAYSRQVFDRLDSFAEPLDGPSFAAWSPLAREFGVTLLFGIPRIGCAGYHISQVAVGPDGALMGHFDKLHIAQYGFSMEKEYFTRGDHLFAFHVRGIKIAPIICYDIRMPELTRTLVLRHGVQMILHCGAYGRDESFDSWHDFVVTRALENQVPVLSLNRAGRAFGESLFCGPWTDRTRPATRFPKHEEAYLELEIDPDEIAAIRERYSFIADKLEDYSALTCLDGGQSGPTVGTGCQRTGTGT